MACTHQKILSNVIFGSYQMTLGLLDLPKKFHGEICIQSLLMTLLVKAVKVIKLYLFSRPHGTFHSPIKGVIDSEVPQMVFWGP